MDNWKLKKIELEFQTFGQHQGKYAGSIAFQNGECESFKFNIRPDMADAYIDLIASDVVKATESLGARLIESLGLTERERRD